MPLGYVLHPTYRIHDGRPVVHLFGRLEDGRAFLIEDDRFRPYFFVRTEQRGALDGHRGIQIEDVELTDLAGVPVTRVETRVPGDVPPGGVQLNTPVSG